MNDQWTPLVWVVDDDPLVRHALARLLRTAGYAVQIHASGEALLASLAHATPDCVVLDLHMPRLSGFEVLAALRLRGAQPDVVVVTGRYDDETHARTVALGARTCLAKPVESDALLEAVAACVRECARPA